MLFSWNRVKSIPQKIHEVQVQHKNMEKNTQIKSYHKLIQIKSSTMSGLYLDYFTKVPTIKNNIQGTGIWQEMLVWWMTSNLHLMFHGMRHLHCQEFMDRIAENTWTCATRLTKVLQNRMIQHYDWKISGLSLRISVSQIFGFWLLVYYVCPVSYLVMNMYVVNAKLAADVLGKHPSGSNLLWYSLSLV